MSDAEEVKRVAADAPEGAEEAAAKRVKSDEATSGSDPADFDAAALDAVCEKICSELKEENTSLIRTLLDKMGKTTGEELLAEALELEKGEGIKTADGERRKTPGGVFLHLARDKIGRTLFNGICQENHKRQKAEKGSSKKTKEEEKPAEKATEEAKEPAATEETKEPEATEELKKEESA
mmetsp:Transcript_9320/g.16356  ORF Transcript_9320/g.16356 Transcript_9320/m.16356 type:complete len:180 (-) Transcript_9320:347-886(-)